MTTAEYKEISEILEKVTYWRKVVDDLKKWQVEVHKDMQCNKVYQKEFPKQGIRYCLKKKKKNEPDRCVFGMCMQGRICSQLLPLESFDVLVEWSEEQLKIAKTALDNIKLKENGNE